MPSIDTESAGPIQMTAEVGRTGLRQYAGYIFEEYDSDLRGQRGARLYHEMRRNDPTVAVGLRLIKWMIGRVPWTVQPGGTTPADEEAAAFLESCLDDMSGTWSKFLRDALTCLDFGFAYIEQVFKVRNGPKGKAQSRYDDGRIGWRKMIPISQETLLRWDIDPEDEGIRGMIQLPSLTGSYTGGEINIPIEKSILFRLDDDRNNPEGVSLLRSAYRPYHLKKNIEEIEAIGIERDLTGVLIIYMPVNATSTDKDKAIQLLEQYKSDDMSGFVAPQMGPGEHERWRFDIINSPGNKTIDPDKVIQRYQMEIARSFLAQFLMLGQGTTGSFALSKDQTDVFELAIGAILSNLEETINRYPVPLLFRLNDFGTLTALPQIKPGKISRGDVERFSMALKNLTDSGLLTPDRNLEAHIRQEMELPELLEEEDQKPTEETGKGEGDEKEAREFVEEEFALPDPEDDEAWEQIEEEQKKRFKDFGLALLGEALRFARPYDYKSKIDEIGDRYRGEMGKLAEQLRTGQIDYGKWSYNSRVLITRYTIDGYSLGVAQAQNIAPTKVKLTQEQRRAGLDAVREQLDYFAKFAKEVKADLKAGKDLTTALDVRARMYAGSLGSADNEARLNELGDQKQRWVRHKSDSCETCLGNDGKVKTAAEWKAGGIWPKHNVKCLSNCGCQLHAVEG